MQTVPDENHKCGVGNGQVCVEESVAVVGITVEVFECGGSWDNEKAAFTHEGNGGIGGAIEEIDAQDAVEVGGQRPPGRRCRCVGHAYVIFHGDVGHNTGISPFDSAMFAYGPVK